jgi:hypothetical protein
MVNVNQFTPPAELAGTALARAPARAITSSFAWQFWQQGGGFYEGGFPGEQC